MKKAKRSPTQRGVYGTMSDESCECKELQPEESTRQTKKRSSNYGNSKASFFESLSHYTWSKRTRGGRRNKWQDDSKLDTNVFESYLENLWSKISEDIRSVYAYIDCLWFSFYLDESTKGKVLRWIKQKDIFSKRYVFVPVVRWGHWSLLILCHFGETQLSNSGKPCMLLLDSLQNAGPERLEIDIRRFVFDIYKTGGRKEHEHLISEIPLLIPKVPQQTSGDECGMFVLYFIHLFMTSAPTIFDWEKYPYFLNEDWFNVEDLKQFSKTMMTIHSQCDPKMSTLRTKLIEL